MNQVTPINATPFMLLAQMRAATRALARRFPRMPLLQQAILAEIYAVPQYQQQYDVREIAKLIGTISHADLQQLHTLGLIVYDTSKPHYIRRTPKGDLEFAQLSRFMLAA